MNFTIIPDNDEPEFWELVNTDTGEVLKTCGTAGEVVYAIMRIMHQIEEGRMENV